MASDSAAFSVRGLNECVSIRYPFVGKISLKDDTLRIVMSKETRPCRVCDRRDTPRPTGLHERHSAVTSLCRDAGEARLHVSAASPGASGILIPLLTSRDSGAGSSPVPRTRQADGRT